MSTLLLNVKWVAVALVAAVVACGGPPTYDLVIRNVAVVDLDSGEYMSHDIGIANDRIAALSPDRLRGRQVYDGGGLWAVPGLWDMHVHLSDPSFFDLMIVNGVVGA